MSETLDEYVQYDFYHEAIFGKWPQISFRSDSFSRYFSVVSDFSLVNHLLDLGHLLKMQYCTTGR